MKGDAPCGLTFTARRLSWSATAESTWVCYMYVGLSITVHRDIRKEILRSDFMHVKSSCKVLILCSCLQHAGQYLADLTE